MEKCIFCGENRPANFKKYCSDKCNKRAWYVRNNPNTKSFFTTKEFWKTETGIGFKWEKYVANLLDAKHLEFNKIGADLDWNGKLIDVKSAHLNFRKNKRGKPVKQKQSGYWCFHHTGNEKSLDFVFCVGLDKENKPIRHFLVPFKEYPKSGMTVGHKSKYDKYFFRPL